MYIWVDACSAGMKSGLARLFFLFPCCLPLSRGLYHCCSAITENSTTWQMLGERHFQIHLCVCACLWERAFVCLLVPPHSTEERFVQDSSGTRCFSVEFDCGTAEAPEKKYINMGIFGDVTWLQGIRMTKDTPVKNDCHRLQGLMRMITAHYNVYTVYTIVLVQRSVW